MDKYQLADRERIHGAEYAIKALKEGVSEQALWDQSASSESFDEGIRQVLQERGAPIAGHRPRVS